MRQASGVKGTGASGRIVASCFEKRAISALSRIFSPNLPGILPPFASTVSRSGYSFSSFTAVFSPTPGTPGILSLLSPIRPLRSVICSGVTPYISFTRAGVNSSVSLMPLRVNSTRL